MMGKQDKQAKLFHVGIDLNRRVRSDHPLRAVKGAVDFSFVRGEVADCYGRNGNESVDPEVILKMLFLLFYENVSSERELMRVIPERLDWMWFLEMDLDDPVPHHSVLSKARARWGVEVFERVFVQTVQACVEASLVGGDKLHVDSSLVQANASRDSVTKGPPEWIAALKRAYGVQEKKLDEIAPNTAAAGKYAPVSDTLMSTTDPDATPVRHGREPSRPRYKCHRAVDDAQGVITATETTRSDVADGLRLMGLIDQHERTTKETVQTAVADASYGTTANFRACAERGIASHMADLRVTNDQCTHRGIYGEDAFQYDATADCYICPAGQRLRRRKHRVKRRVYEYAAGRAVCGSCALKPRCTRSAERTVRRHEGQEQIDRARRQANSNEARRSRRRRKHLIEGSFAQSANRHHFKRARWRRLWRQQIQDYLIAAVQNIGILVRNRTPNRSAAAGRLLGHVRGSLAKVASRLRLPNHGLPPMMLRLASLRIQTTITQIHSES